MRGRTFVNKFLIIDEAEPDAQADEDLGNPRRSCRKIQYLGNIAQIDKPYLTEGSSGLTYMVNRFKDWGWTGYVAFALGERSRLVDHASDVL